MGSVKKGVLIGTGILAANAIGIIQGVFLGIQNTWMTDYALTQKTGLDFSRIHSVAAVVKQSYPDAFKDGKTEKAIMTAIVEGTQDKFAAYIGDMKELVAFEGKINNDYEGIGVMLDQSKEEPVISKVFAGSPASASGISEGDKIIGYGNAIDPTTIKDEIRKDFSNEGQKTVKLKLQRGKETFSTELKSSSVHVPTAAAANTKGVIYSAVAMFSEKTADDISSDLVKSDLKNARGIVFDLRDNGGGFVSGAEKLLGLFLPKGNEMYSFHFNDGKEEKKFQKEDPKFDLKGKKIVIVVNENTASASEIFLLSMKNAFPDIKIVGTKTYGKNVVQDLFVTNKGDILKMTVATWSVGEASAKGGIPPTNNVECGDERGLNKCVEEALSVAGYQYK